VKLARTEIGRDRWRKGDRGPAGIGDLARVAERIEGVFFKTDTVATAHWLSDNLELSLEEALKRFERGVGLARECQRALQQAEQKVEILLQKNATAEPDPFEPDEG